MQTGALTMQILLLVTVLLLLCSSNIFAQTVNVSDGDFLYAYPIGDVRNCPSYQPTDLSAPLYRMAVLPGLGFDNLRNLEKSQVFNYNFSTCKISSDGRYLLPDNVFLIPNQKSNVEVFAEFFDHWDDYKSMTSASINVETSSGFFARINAKFSSDYMSTKTRQVKENSKTTRVQIRYNLYTVKIQPDAMLHPTFKSRLFDIAASQQNNDTELANYLAELLVRDYGTHVVTSTDAGASLAQIDQVASSFLETSGVTTTNIRASASVSFLRKFSLSTTFEYGTTTEMTSGFLNNRMHSEVVTMGGPPFRPNLTIEEWVNGVPNALVAVDRSGEPLHFTITTETIPELPPTVIRDLADTVYSAINRYYSANTMGGCTQVTSSNFNFQANIDDGSCRAVRSNFGFGGIYQLCQVHPEMNRENLCSRSVDVKNPLTESYGCSNGYVRVPLHNGTVSRVSYQTVCDRRCRNCGLFGWGRCCRCNNIRLTHLSSASYQGYWCRATSLQQSMPSPFLFGGYYTSKTSNPVTRSMSCPHYFMPMPFLEDVQICISREYDLGSQYAIPFGGFYSCSIGNPYTALNTSNANNPSMWPRECPPGYMPSLVTVIEGCDVSFCMRSTFSLDQELQNVKLPPYRNSPKFKDNVTDTYVIFGLYGNIYTKNADGEWVLATPDDEDEGMEVLMTLTGDNTNGGGGSVNVAVDLSSNAIIAVSVCATVIAIIAIIVFCCCCFRRKSRKKQQDAEDHHSMSGIPNPAAK